MFGQVKWTAVVLTCPNKDWAQVLQKGTLPVPFQLSFVFYKYHQKVTTSGFKKESHLQVTLGFL